MLKQKKTKPRRNLFYKNGNGAGALAMTDYAVKLMGEFHKTVSSFLADKNIDPKRSSLTDLELLMIKEISYVMTMERHKILSKSR